MQGAYLLVSLSTQAVGPRPVPIRTLRSLPPVDRDISLSLDPTPRPISPSPASIAIPPQTAVSLPAPVAPPALDAAALPEPLWQALARHQLLLPLLRHATVAAAVAPVPISDQERSQVQQAWAAKNGIRSAEQLQAHLASQALSQADAIWQAELPLRISRHCEEHFVHRAEQRFLARKNQLDQVIYSLLRVEDASLARELYLRIAEGEADFAELAASYACGPEKATRGIVGPVPLLQAHPVLAEKLRTSRPGELQPPLQIEQWWLVLRLESLQPASFDDGMRRRMAHELFEEWVEQEVRGQLAARAGTAAPTP
jgi:hypothetical protein